MTPEEANEVDLIALRGWFSIYRSTYSQHGKNTFYQKALWRHILPRDICSTVEWLAAQTRCTTRCEETRIEKQTWDTYFWKFENNFRTISGHVQNFRTISGHAQNFRTISGQFLDNFRFRRIPADAGGFRRKGNRIFLVFYRISEIPGRRFRRIPADNQKSARNQTRNTTTNQKLSRNYFLNGLCQQIVSESHPNWILDSREVLAQRLLVSSEKRVPSRGLSSWQSTWSNFALSSVFGCFWQRIPWRRHLCCQIHSLMKYSDGIPCQACKKWLCGQIFSFWAD